jgi:sugar lactone lactonase YvrE
VVVDANYIYVTDTRTNLVDIFNKSDGTFAVSFGGIGHGVGKFSGPEGLAVAPNGLIYVTDTYNDRVQRWCLNTCPAVLAGAAAVKVTATRAQVTPTIVSPTYVSTVGVSGEALTYPGGVAVDSAGNVFVADTGNDTIEKFAAGTGTPAWSVGLRGAPIGGGTDSFENPRDLAVDSNYVYVGDTDNGTVQVLNKVDGSYVQSFAQTYKSPIGMGVGTDGSGHERILVSDGTTGSVYVYDSTFHLVLTILRTTANEGTRDAATDSAGNIYTADYRNDRIDKYNSSGVLVAQFGGGAPNACNVWPRPYGVDVDDAGHVYVASSDKEVITEFNPSDGSCIKTFGQKGKGPQQLFQLRRVAVGRGPNPLVYAADLWGLKILTYNQDGTFSANQPEIGNGTYPSPGGLNEPHGIAVTSQYVYVTDTVNQRMQRFNLDGTSPIAWGIKGTPESTASFNWAEGIAVDPSGNVWVANTRNNRLDEFDANGAGPLRSVGMRTGGGSITFNWPMDLTFDSSGNLYVADTFNDRIQAFSVTPTTVTRMWAIGTHGSGVGNFFRPWSVAYDAGPAGPRLLVTDTFNGRIVSLDPSTGAWNGVLPISRGTGVGRVKAPQGITVTTGGQIWISDTGNSRIEEFNSDGTFANEMLGGYGTSNSQLNAPQGIQIGPNGLLYVGDVSNNRIQVFQPV